MRPDVPASTLAHHRASRLVLVFACSVAASTLGVSACACKEPPAEPTSPAALPLPQERLLEPVRTEPASPAALPLPQERLLEPVRALLAALDSEDADAIRAAFANDATQAYGTQSWKSPADFGRWLESDIIERKGKVEHPVFSFEGDGEIVVKGTYRSIGYQNAADFLFTVEDGKITSWRMRY